MKKLYVSFAAYFVLSTTISLFIANQLGVNSPNMWFTTLFGFLSWFVFELAIVQHLDSKDSPLKLKVMAIGWLCLAVVATMAAYVGGSTIFGHPETVNNVRSLTLATLASCLLGGVFYLISTYLKNVHELKELRSQRSTN